MCSLYILKRFKKLKHVEKIKNKETAEGEILSFYEFCHPFSLSKITINCQISHFGKFKKLVSRYTGIRDSFYSIFLTIIPIVL